MVLATSGSTPYTVADVERTAGQAANYFANASFGKVKLQIDVTPWLAAFTANPGCGGTTNHSVHGLGHACGLVHAQASDCITVGGVCGIDETGDPFEPMGSGVVELSAYEKV